MCFEKELSIYEQHLSELLNSGGLGKYVVIKNTISPILEDYDSALNYGYENYGLESFLVKKIELTPTAEYLYLVN